ncbi:MAG: hypothetical protein WC213_00920 [Arenimonas sp.]|jgi:hypothetical protein
MTRTDASSLRFATALGSGAQATGSVNATAIGWLANASATNSTSIGANSVASGVGATAVGRGAQATSDNAFSGSETTGGVGFGVDL